MKKFALALGVMMLAVLSTAQPVVPKARGFDTSSIGITQNLGQRLPLETEWIDENNKRVKLGDYFNDGKAVILVPVFYTCNGTCVLVLEGVLGSLNALKNRPLGDGFKVVTFSIDPNESDVNTKIRRDQVLDKYRFKGVGEKNWHFLRGDMKNITTLTTAIGFKYSYEVFKAEKQDERDLVRINHAAGIMIATPTGNLNEYFYGQEFAGTMMKKAIDRALKNEVAMATTPILLGCFMYDPMTGKWRPVVHNLMIVLGTSTVIILALSIYLMSRRSASQPRLGTEGPSDPV